MTTTIGEDQRELFYRLVPELLADDPRLALVLADIGAGYIESTPDIADRIVNVGIREQLMIGVAGGMALAGVRPIVHSFPPFLIERPFEQVKLDLGHQDVGAMLVSAGGSYNWPQGGETHFGHRDVALLDTLDGWTVEVPGHPREADDALRRGARSRGRVYVRLDATNNREPYSRGDGFTVLRQGRRGTVVSVGPMTDRVLDATHDRDVTVLHATTIRPFDAHTLRHTLATPDVVVVEPYLAGTSVPHVSAALADTRHRVLGLGVSHAELRRYGTVDDHDRAHGLDVNGLRDSIDRFLLDG